MCFLPQFSTTDRAILLAPSVAALAGCSSSNAAFDTVINQGLPLDPNELVLRYSLLKREKHPGKMVTVYTTDTKHDLVVRTIYQLNWVCSFINFFKIGNINDLIRPRSQPLGLFVMTYEKFGKNKNFWLILRVPINFTLFKFEIQNKVWKIDISTYISF